VVHVLAVLLLAQDRLSPEWQPLLEAPKNLSHELTIAPPVNSGPRLEIRGKVFRADGKTPVPGVILYFHHTDGTGVYPRPAGARPSDWSYWHGSLRGWLKTDSQGNYVLKTTRPAPYPRRQDPAHIHVYGLPQGSRRGVYFSDIVFEGDRFLTRRYWDMVRRDGLEVYGGVRLTTSENGVLQGKKDLILPR
jgi:protocatechuate 3,4-dioxygenase beta subunit